ncbi:hypothetical protein [Streptomyces hydrogenans]|uniref:hypothetical protein n=1 Tax=Streptomyces hydrogenans TaxID=1873719 RepID=UPI00380F50E0
MTTAAVPLDINPPPLPTGWWIYWDTEPTHDYIRATGTLPPQWTTEQIDQWQDRRTDQLIRVRRIWDPAAYQSATRWLLRHGLDHAGHWRPDLTP